MKFPKIPNISEICGIEEIVEFIGLHSLGCDLELEDVIESRENDFEYEEVGSARILNWRGFFSCERICELVRELR